MKTLTTKCIILGHKNFGEKDKIVFLYSEELGKIKAIAKGSRNLTSKFMGHLETLNFCIAQLYFGPKNIILTEIATDKNFLRDRSKLNTVTSALKVAEITNKMLLENQKIENLNKLIEKTILHIAISKKPILISLAYIIKLLDRLGYMPQFKETSLITKLKTERLSDLENLALSKKDSVYIQKLIKTLSIV